MLNENIKTSRKLKGLSQEELAIKLNVVRQTISKWEQGLSVPDSEMLISLSEEIDTPVSTLLGEKISDFKVDGIKAISEKLEIINLQLSQMKISRRKKLHLLFILLSLMIIAI
ncbi:helix-turn-helix transcriptional regulator [Erysipelothrix rhusiopathiae]|nr:helix-turn-helix transcriptional regulator [Erysipelothrix rhusiopathiae]